MNFFLVNPAVCKNIRILLYSTAFLMLVSCATKKAQYGEKAATHMASDSIAHPKPAHRFYLIGDAGYAAEPHTKKLLTIINNKLETEDKNTTLLYLGDNIYPYGMPVDKGDKDRKEAEKTMNAQLALSKSFKGRTVFIPGNHDWYNGLEGLKQQENFVRDFTGEKKSFLPGKGCGIDDVEINDSITLITIDSQWYIEDWDKYPTINDNCDIKTREAMFVEFESLLNKNQDKTIILAIHHPLMSNGTHGGQFSLEKQLFPLKYKIPMPGLGSLINLARKTSGYSTQDIQSRIYSSLVNRLKTLIQDKDNVVVVSGHDHNLQFICKDNINQVISGAGSKEEAARAVNPDDFTYGGTGYAILDVYKDGSATAAYFALENESEKKIFESKPMMVKHAVVMREYPASFPNTITTSVYTPAMTKKSRFYKFLFGEHYRKYYSMPIKVNVATLDTLRGGLVTGREGGGHQSRSLRLVDKDGREYVMRGIKKSATRFLQTVAFKDRYIGDTYANTFAEDFLLDFYTTAHPYTPFVVGSLAESSGIYHSNPQLLYIPKQLGLGSLNQEYGDEMYMVEERPDDEFKALASFGNADALVSTEDMLINLRKNTKYFVDEKAYIRARLFDMLIGDWDRHADQWRWAEFDRGNKIIYKPVPKDRDQAFTRYDGTLLSIFMSIPALRHMKTLKEDINNVKWFNREPYPLDVALLTISGEKEWVEEARHLQESLTDEEIDAAFKNLPAEVQDKTAEDIKGDLKKRKLHLEEFAIEYNRVLLKTVLIAGSDKKEKFIITRLPDGVTDVKVYSLEKDGKLVHSKLYNKESTKEIWLYGLDDDDEFEVTGKPDNPILVRLMGGQNNDIYTFEDGKNVRVYDFRSKKNTYGDRNGAKLILTDDYETNSYDINKPKYSFMAWTPSGGYNPDDGIKLGGQINYTVNNFNRRPYSQRHSLSGNYFFATDGFEFLYRGRFMNVATKWNFAVDVLYTSPNFSINFFGLGNETENNEDRTGRDFNRVKLQIFRIAPYFFSQSRNGSYTEIQSVFETLEIDGTNNRFVNQPGAAPERLFSHRQFAGLSGKCAFENYDNKALPSLGMSFYLSGGWKVSMDEIKRNFPHLESAISFIHKLTGSASLVATTNMKARALLNNSYEFYQAATLGGDTDLRGYRRERFTGKCSFVHSTDFRYTLSEWKSSFIPVKYGVTAGYDYGRVWLKNDQSDKWHQSAGAGLWLSGADSITAKAAYFVGSDGGRVSVGLGLGF